MPVRSLTFTSATTSTSPLLGHKRLRTPEHRPLPPLPMFHLTPLATPQRLSSDPATVHLSFDPSWCSLPPLDLGMGEPCLSSSVSVPIQAGATSVTGLGTLSSLSASTLKLTDDHALQIFNLACEGQHLKERVLREFIKLSKQEVLFHTQGQSTGHEILASGHPEHFTAYYAILRSDKHSSEAKDKAREELMSKAREVWLQMQPCSSTY